MPGGFAVNPNLAIVAAVHVPPRRADGDRPGLDGGHFFGYSLLHYYAFGTHRPGVTDVWEEFQERARCSGSTATIASPAPAIASAPRSSRTGIGSLRGAVGTPDQVRDLLRRYEEVGVDQIIFVAQAGKNRHEHICESMELFADEVMPEFHDRDLRHVKDKEQRLAPAIEAALARRAPARQVDPEYSFPAVPLPDRPDGRLFAVLDGMTIGPCAARLASRVASRRRGLRVAVRHRVGRARRS